jgi:tryptophan synthase beta chain
VTDQQAMDAFSLLSRTEGIIPALESAHALAGAMEVCRELRDHGAAAGGEPVVLVCLSGRGDKDVDTAARWLNLMPGGPERESGGEQQ